MTSLSPDPREEDEEGLDPDAELDGEDLEDEDSEAEDGFEAVAGLLESEDPSLGPGALEDESLGDDGDDLGEEEELPVEMDAAEEDGEEGEPQEQGAEETSSAAPKKKKLDDEVEEVEHPDTPVPTMKKMVAVLKWAFEGEDEVTEDLIERFAKHAIMTLEKNREINLTAMFDPEEIAVKQYLDSWRITRLVPLIARKVVDLGSGAGFPGLPLALAEPNLSMTLVDSKKQKAEFLQESIEALGLRNCRAVWNRAEDYLATERVDVVVVRAVSSVRENVRTLRKVRHSLQDYVMIKGNSWSREVRAAEREAERLGFKLDTVWEHELPDEMGGRAILVYRAPGGAGY